MQRDVQVKRKAEVEPTAHSLLRFSQVSEPEIAEIDSASADLLKYKDLVKNALGEGDLWSTKPNPTFSYASASNLLVPHLSVETIKAKQLVLKCLLGDYLLKPQETLTRLEELLFACKLFDNSCWWRLSSRRDWDHGKKRYQSYESMIKGHLPTYQYMMGSPEGRVEALDDIDEFKKVISRFKIEKSPELKSFVDRMPRLIEAFKAYQERLEKVGIPRQPELVDILPRSISSKFSSNAEYCHAVDNEISDKGEEIENFRLEVQSLKQLINLAAFICKEGLKPLIVRGSGASMFKGAQHPFLVQKMGRSKVVPFSMRIDPKRQIIFFTGVNGCGKSKVVENIILNLILAQSCGFAYVENGVLGSLRSQFGIIQSFGSRDISDDEYSRGQFEMKSFIEQVLNDTKPGSMHVLDEILTSTDSLRALQVMLAVLEHNANKDCVSLVTVHSRDLKKVIGTSVGKKIRFLRGKSSKNGQKFSWTSGVGVADPIALALETGLPAKLAKRAIEIGKEMRKSEKPGDIDL